MLKISLWGQISLQDANSPIIEGILIFYDHVIIIVMIIISLIFYILFFIFINKIINRFIFEGQLIEIVWTVIPIFLLIFIALPSLKILYLTDELNNSIIRVKVIGSQWYWSYEYSDFLEGIEIESYILQKNYLNSFRLLDVDNRIVLPINSQIRFLITSTDVIHSFAIPSIGLKVDAVPGRINQISSYINRYGLYFGQCSEICGVNHRFIPIVIEATDLSKFLTWLNSVE